MHPYLGRVNWLLYTSSFFSLVKLTSKTSIFAVRYAAPTEETP